MKVNSIFVRVIEFWDVYIRIKLVVENRDDNRSLQENEWLQVSTKNYNIEYHVRMKVYKPEKTYIFIRMSFKDDQIVYKTN